MNKFGYVKQLDASNTGMVYKFTKKEDAFIHTLCVGELLFHLGFTQGDIVGKTLHDFYPEDYAKIKHQYYLEAWKGNFVQYETEINGVYQVASLRPEKKNGKVVEVVGSCIDVTKHTKKQSADHELKTSFINSNKEKNNKKSNLIIKHYNNIVFIPLVEIIFIERRDRKSIIITINKQYESYDSLTSLCQQLDKRFLECHRSYIINMDYLEIIESKGQSYIGRFRNYSKPIKISKNKILLLQTYKSS
ncbi:LytTR family transcriptional regulator DNA-binding domain-containing protein [Metabacillus halosaccharovorans]|uniref:LytTR family transcriptional regulator DNA-binding domain-containing protein n=1 Tax=Metabacillus halosaccharovorans TaxID=930124 RepID=UPI003736C206